MLVLIFEGKGWNKLVEAKRGKKHIWEHLPPEETTMDKEQRCNESAAPMLAPETINDLLEEYNKENDADCKLHQCEV